MTIEKFVGIELLFQIIPRSMQTALILFSFKFPSAEMCRYSFLILRNYKKKESTYSIKLRFSKTKPAIREIEKQETFFAPFGNRAFVNNIGIHSSSGRCATGFIEDDGTN